MQKEIKYRGFTATPSDYECPDGDLTGALNLINEDGALKPVVPPAEKFSLEFTWDDYSSIPVAEREGATPTERDGVLDKVLCIHKVGTHSNYLFAMKDDEVESDAKWYLLYCLGEPTTALKLEDTKDSQPYVAPQSSIPGMSSNLGTPASDIIPVKPVIDIDDLIIDGGDNSGHGDIPDPNERLDDGDSEGGDTPGPGTIPDPFDPDTPDPNDEEDDDDEGMDINPDAGASDDEISGTEGDDVTVWGDGTLYYIKSDDGKFVKLKDIIGVEIVGNMVLVLTEEGINYIHYVPAKDEKPNQYTYLGTHLPEIDIRFALEQRYKTYNYGKWTLAEDENGTKTELPAVWIPTTYTQPYAEYDFDKIGKDTSALKDTAKAAANKASQRFSTKENRFQYPFFVRFAYRLYDDSLTMHSPPILMASNIGSSNWPFPLVRVEEYYNDGSGESDAMVRHLTVEMLTHGIQYMIGENMKKLERWKDIIKSIDVFVSAPLYTYNQAGTKFEMHPLNKFSGNAIYSLARDKAGNDNLHRYLTLSTSINKHGAAPTDPPSDSNRGAGFNRTTAYNFNGSNSGLWTPHYIKLPWFTASEMRDKVLGCANFYLWKSLKVKDLAKVETGKYNSLTVKEGYMQSLTERERMTDDYFSHCEEIPKLLHTYNQRLNMAGLRRRAFTNCYFNNFFCYTDGVMPYESIDENDEVELDENNEPVMEGVVSGGNIIAVRFYVHIRRDKEIIIRSYQGYMNDNVPVPYFFYPDPQAYKVVFECRKIYKEAVIDEETGKVTKDDDNNPIYKITVSNSATFYTIDLETHAGLNGAVWFDNFRTALSEDRKIYASGNTASGRSVIQENTRFSQGKDLLEDLGNKLYTSEVNNPFIFNAKNVTTVGNGQILGLAAAVRALSQGQFGQFPLYAFTTEGVWSLEVSSTGGFSSRQPVTRDVVLGNGESITSLDSSVFFAADRGIMQLAGSGTVCISDGIRNIEALPIADLQGTAALFADATGLEIAPLNEFLQGCRMIYDYTNQRVIVYNPARHTETENNHTTEVRTYPYAYVYSLKTQMWGMTLSKIEYGLNSYPDAFAVDEDKNVVDMSPDSADVTVQSISGLIVTRPLKLDNGDVLKTVDTVIQRGYFRKGHVKGILYGSRDLFHWHAVWSSTDHYMRGFRGTPYKYFRMVLKCDLDKDESVSGCTVQFTPRYTNRLK